MSDPGFPKIRDSDAVPGRAFNASTTSVLLEHLLHFVREIMSTVRAYDALQKLHVYPLWPLAAGCHHIYIYIYIIYICSVVAYVTTSSPMHGDVSPYIEHIYPCSYGLPYTRVHTASATPK